MKKIIRSFCVGLGLLFGGVASAYAAPLSDVVIASNGQSVVVVGKTAVVADDYKHVRGHKKYSKHHRKHKMYSKKHGKHKRPLVVKHHYKHH